MKKIYLLFITLFLLTGCTVEYSLEFNNDILEEKIILGPITENAKAELDFFEPYAIESYGYEDQYDVNLKNDIMTLKYKYNKNLYGMSTPLNDCYDLSSFSYDDEYYYLLTSKEFKCLNYAGYETEEVKINFKTNYDVVSNNADYVNNDTYTWVINNNNYQDKAIEIKLDKNSITQNEEENNKGNSKIFWLIVGIIVIILTIFILSIKSKMSKRDEI